MTRGACAAAAARRAVGARFRLHGRDLDTGLDCVGLVAVALRAAGIARAIADDYALRGGDIGRIAGMIEAAGLVRGDGTAPGDVLLFDAGPAQLHLAVRVAGGIVHADGVLRRVVERPGPAPWPMIGAWRLTGD